MNPLFLFARRIVLPSLALAWLVACDLPFIAGKGGGSETETQVFALTGHIHDSSGLAGHNYQVMIWPDTQLVDLESESLPSPVATANTDGKGNFKIDSLPLGRFRIYFTGNTGLTAVQELTVEGKPRALSLKSLTIDSGGSLEGDFDTTASRRMERYVQIYGIPRYARCNAAGHWKFEGLPVGTHRLRFVTKEPFRIATTRDSVVIVAGERKNLGPQFSQRGLKIEKLNSSKGLQFLGVDKTNPVVLDNELCQNQADMAFNLMAASKGALNLKGWIVTKDFSVTPSRSLDEQIDECRELRDLANQSGFPVTTEPVPGATNILAKSTTGKLVDMIPEPSAGVSLLLAEAAKATPQKPLVIIVGGPLSTIASAYLLDPSIVERSLVVAMFSDWINSKDTLANFLVAKKFRFVHWGRGYVASKDTNLTWLEKIPSHPLGLFARSKLADDSRNFGDLPGSLLLIDPSIFSGATARILQAPPLQSILITDSSYGDFWDIEKGQNDFDRMQQTVFDSLEKWVSPNQSIDTLSGLNFHSSQGVTLSKTPPETLVAQFPLNSKATWNLHSATAGSYTVYLTVRNTANAEISVSLENATSEVQAVAASDTWQLVSFVVDLPAGDFQLHLQSDLGSFDLLNMRVQ